jgi:hypothetical protein
MTLTGYYSSFPSLSEKTGIQIEVKRKQQGVSDRKP